MLAWHSLQLKTPWTLAACLAESIEMFFPLSDFIPPWPWQARQLSSCLSGCGNFACARARAYTGEPSGRRPAKRIKARKTRPIVVSQESYVASFPASPDYKVRKRTSSAAILKALRRKVGDSRHGWLLVMQAED